jgi:sec-independent protein translocase protein TatA
MLSNILLWSLGGGEIIVIILIVLLLFGGKKIPELARGLGKGIREFKDASKGVSDDDKKIEEKK